MRSPNPRLVVLSVVLGVVLSFVPGVASATTPALPAAVDLRAYSVPVADQGDDSSCVGWALGYTLLGWYSRYDGYAGQPFAPMYVYSQIDGGLDDGSKVVDGLEVLRTQGVDTAAHYLQGPLDWLTPPDAAERANAAHWRVSGYSVLFEHPSLGAGGGTAGEAIIKQSLAAHRPVAITVDERPGFDDLRGTAVDHDTTGLTRTDHALVAVGYDATGLLVQNSFGTDWGDGGFGRIGWDVVEKDVTGAYVVDGFAALDADRTAPTVTAPRMLARTGASVGASGATPFTVSFTAGDASGVTATRLYRRRDGGAWTRVALPRATSRSVVTRLAPGHRYRFSAAARDDAGNWSDRVLAPSVRIVRRGELNSAVRYSKHWSTAHRPGALQGRVRVTSHAKASVRLSFTGRGVAWIATESRTRGSAKVYLDGVARGTVALHSARTHDRVVVFRVSASRPGHHRLRIVQKTTHGRRTVDVDGFVVTS